MDATIGRYQLLGQIGQGGLGVVHRARDTSLGRTVALKLPSGELTGDPAGRTSLLAAAKAASALSHPNIAALVEAGEEGGQLYLAFEFAAGEVLPSLLGDRPLHVRRAVDIASQIADALAAAHALRIIHGDLKPANIIVTSTGRVKVLDFGLSRWTLGGASRRAAAVGWPSAAQGQTAAMTIPYMSPEQADGADGDPQSDIFSLAIILYEMLTGQRPFAGATPAETLAQIRALTPTLPTVVNPLVSPRLGVAVMRALSKRPDDRFRHILDLQRELRMVATALDNKAADAPAIAPRQTTHPRRSIVPMVVGLAAAIAALAVWMLWRN